MDAKKSSYRDALLPIAVFALVAVIASAIPVSALWGKPGQTFTLFEFIGVLPAAFLGPALGIISIIMAKGASILLLGTPLDLATALRFLPPILGAYFFATYKSKNGLPQALQISIPLVCIALFIAHPVGSQAWQFSLYWLIPPILAIIPANNVYFRSLGATFTQHAIGGIIWLYFVAPMTPAAWLALIPVVAVERLLFASGISISYLAANAIASRVKWLANSRFVQIAPMMFASRKK